MKYPVNIIFYLVDFKLVLQVHISHHLTLTKNLVCYGLISTFRGIGAVVYKVPELENDEKLKISLRSLDNEDTTPISQVVPSSSC